MEVDQLITVRIGWDLPYSLIFMGTTALLFLWSLVRVVKFGFAMRRENWKPTIKNWLFFIAWLLFLVVFYGSFWLILRANVSQKGVVFHLLNIIRLFSDSLVLLIIVMGFRPTLNYLKKPGIENLRPVAATLSTRFEKGDKIYVYYAAKPAFTYYYRDYVDSQIYGISSRRNPEAYFVEIDDLLVTNDRIWMVFSHCYADECELIPNFVAEKRNVLLQNLPATLASAVSLMHWKAVTFLSHQP